MKTLLTFIIFYLRTQAQVSAETIFSSDAAWKTECLGYYSFKAPGSIVYPAWALQSFPDSSAEAKAETQYVFSDGAALGDNRIFIYLINSDETSSNLQFSGAGSVYNISLAMKINNDQLLDSKRILISEANSLADSRNKTLFDLDKWFETDKRIKAERISLYKSLNGGQAIAAPFPVRPNASDPPSSSMGFATLLNGNIWSGRLTMHGGMQETLDAFMSHAHKRNMFDVPDNPGVCLPYAFITGETRPARISMGWRLASSPDILVHLAVHDAAGDRMLDAKDWLIHNGNNIFAGAKQARPADKVRPFRSLQIDGHEALGAFALIERIDDMRNPENAAGTDWGYLAVAPGLNTGRPGEHFDVRLRVERYGKAALKPMTESEFRALALEIAASIRRRPNGWIVK